MEFGDDLFDLIDRKRRDLGLTQAEVSKRAFGRSGDTSLIQNLRRTKNGPTARNLKALCDAVGLEFYVGPKRDAEIEVPTIHLGATDFSTIPLMNVSVSAGNGRIVAEPEDEEARLAFSRKWLLTNRVEAEQSILVRVTGDSMAPTVPDKAVVLVDRSGASVRKEGIFAIHYDGVVQVKRLVPISPRSSDILAGIVVVSDNHGYPPMTILGPELHELRIIGRVRACLSAMP